MKLVLVGDLVFATLLGTSSEGDYPAKTTSLCEYGIKSDFRRGVLLEYQFIQMLPGYSTSLES
jgi:hypothetical protein